MTLRDQLTDAQRDAVEQEIVRALASPRSAVPDHLRDGLALYFADGILPGGWLQAVLCNNLRETVARGTTASLGALPALIELLLWHAPAQAWGTREKVRAWTTTPERLEIER
jgi:hypothetical protein